jgi:hypothetical protein
MTDLVPWKRALEGAIFVALIQFFAYYFQFVVTDCIPPAAVLIKTFLFAPFLIFLVNWAQFELLNKACCQKTQSEANKIIAFGGVTKALIVTWATTPLVSLQGLRSVGLLIATFVISIIVFFLVGYETATNLKSCNTSSKQLPLPKSKGRQRR